MTAAKHDGQIGFRLWLSRSWSARRRARRDRRMLLKVLWNLSPFGTMLCTCIGLLQAVAAVAVVVSVGSAIGDVAKLSAEPAMQVSDLRRDLIRVICGIGLSLAIQYTLIPVLYHVTTDLGRRVDGLLRAQMMNAVGRPSGIGHLEDERMVALLESAKGIGNGRHTPGLAVGAFFRTIGTWFTVVADAALVAAVVSPALACFLVIAVLGLRFVAVDDIISRSEADAAPSEGLRLARYYRDLAVRRGPAAEVRCFGLSAWLRQRQETAWLESMKVVIRRRGRQRSRAWTWSVPWAVVSGLALLEIGRGEVRGSLSLTSAGIAFQAALGAISVWLHPDDVALEYGARAIPAFLELEAQLRGPKAGNGPERVATSTLLDWRRGPSVQFSNVTFRYPTSGSPVLNEVSLEIPSGTSMAIVGMNGAGKSTLVKLLLGMYEQDGGAVLADGRDIREFEPGAWQRGIAAVFQDFVRYPFSVRDNVTLGCISKAEDESGLQAVAEATELVELVSKLEDGWRTIVKPEGGGAVGLSGGQWQRLAIARGLFALHAGAGLLVLDEPTSSLDPSTEADVFQRVLRSASGATVLLISHRFSTVRMADRICVLDKGRVVEVGSHAELVANGGLYAEAFRSQAAMYVGHSRIREDGYAPEA